MEFLLSYFLKAKNMWVALSKDSFETVIESNVKIMDDILLNGIIALFTRYKK